MQVFLNDWATAVPLYEQHFFKGALAFAADEILAVYPRMTITHPRHDLEMIVKMMYACVNLAYYNDFFPVLGKYSTQKDFTDTINCWTNVRRLSSWKPLFEAAHAVRYEELQALILTHLPPARMPSALPVPSPAPTVRCK